MENTEKLSKELDEMLEEFGPIEEDFRLKTISDEEFEKSIKEASEYIQNALEEFEESQLRARKKHWFTIDK